MHTFFSRALPTSALAGACLALAACGGGSAGDRPAAAAFAAHPAADLVVVPNVVGASQERAHRLMNRAGLKMTFAFPGGFSSGWNEIPCVKIATQAPAGGERRPRGSSVMLIEVTCRKVYPKHAGPAPYRYPPS